MPALAVAPETAFILSALKPLGVGMPAEGTGGNSAVDPLAGREHIRGMTAATFDTLKFVERRRLWRTVAGS